MTDAPTAIDCPECGRLAFRHCLDGMCMWFVCVGTPQQKGCGLWLELEHRGDDGDTWLLRKSVAGLDRPAGWS